MHTTLGMPFCTRPGAKRWNARPAVSVRALVAALAFLAGGSATAASPYQPYSDPLLERIIASSLATLPELSAMHSNISALRERTRQDSSWADPMLQFGVQNGSFTTWDVGKMEMSYYSIMLSQTFPISGAPKLRGAIAGLAATQGETVLARLRLSTEAEVRKLYIDLLLTRARRVLVERLIGLWSQAVEVARSTYEAGGGSQADILRSRLEVRRLRQRRSLLDAAESSQVQSLNRLRGEPMDAPLPTDVRLENLDIPPLFQEAAAVEDATERSPELAASRIAVQAAEQSTVLARRSYIPDLTLSFGVMPRGGGLSTMWQASIGGTIPIFAGSKQSRAVAAGVARTQEAQANIEATKRLVQLRVRQRYAALKSLREILLEYRDGLLAESRATADSTLIQYQTGKAPFAAVLDAMAGVLRDEDGYLESLAAAHDLIAASIAVSTAASAAPSAPAEPAGSMSGASSSPEGNSSMPSGM